MNLERWMGKITREFKVFAVIVFFATVSAYAGAVLLEHHAVWKGILESIGEALLTILVIGIFYEVFSQAKLAHEIAALQNALRIGLADCHDSARAYLTDQRLNELIQRADRVGLAGISLSYLTNTHIDALLERSRHGCAVELIVVDPSASAIKQRMRDEGPDNFEGRLPRIRERIVKFAAVADAGKKQNFHVRVSSGYPTLAIARFGEHLYVYPYGFKMAGMNAPLFHFDNLDTAVAKFFLLHFRNVYQDAVDISTFAEQIVEWKKALDV